MRTDVAGRDDEIRRVHEFVEAKAERPVALALAGEAGIGKTTMWRIGVDHGQRREMLVRVANKTQASRFAALLDNYIRAQTLAINAQLLRRELK